MKTNWKIGIAALTLLSSLVAIPSAAQDKRQEMVLSNIWWNQDSKIKALSLTEEQRSKMDGHLQAYLDARQVYASERDAYQAFKKALGRGDMEAAENAREEILENLEAPMRLQLDLMITATGELTAEQRKQVASDYPKLFSRPWVRFTASRSGRPGSDRPSAKAGGGGG